MKNLEKNIMLQPYPKVKDDNPVVANCKSYCLLSLEIKTKDPKEAGSYYNLYNKGIFLPGEKKALILGDQYSMV